MSPTPVRKIQNCAMLRGLEFSMVMIIAHGTAFLDCKSQDMSSRGYSVVDLAHEPMQALFRPGGYKNSPSLALSLSFIFLHFSVQDGGL